LKQNRKQATAELGRDALLTLLQPGAIPALRSIHGIPPHWIWKSSDPQNGDLCNAIASHLTLVSAYVTVGLRSGEEKRSLIGSLPTTPRFLYTVTMTAAAPTGPVIPCLKEGLRVQCLKVQHTDLINKIMESNLVLSDLAQLHLCKTHSSQESFSTLGQTTQWARTISAFISRHPKLLEIHLNFLGVCFSLNDGAPVPRQECFDMALKNARWSRSFSGLKCTDLELMAPFPGRLVRTMTAIHPYFASAESVSIEFHDPMYWKIDVSVSQSNYIERNGC